VDLRQSPEEIRKVAMEFDSAIESKNVELALSGFADDCEIELLGARLIGKQGARKWLDWLYKNLAEVKFVPVTVMVDGSIYFEEFILGGKLHNGVEVRSKQAEVLIYENLKIKSLRLYFDRLDFADAAAKGPISRAISRRLVRTSLRGLA
jgi:hypothetical protein